MMQLPHWDAIDLVVFDGDVTLYDQRWLRRVMVGQLLLDAWRLRSLQTLRRFRQVREALGEEPGADFMRLRDG